MKDTSVRFLSVLAIFSIVIALSSCRTASDTSGPSTSSAGIPNVQNSSEANETGINVDGSIISWANMKVDNPDLNLTEEQLQVVKYFDNDYITVSDYDNLQRYPKIFRNAQICFPSIVVKVLQMDDESYECLVCMDFLSEYYKIKGEDFWGDEPIPSYDNFRTLLIIRGKQPENARIAVGDWLYCYGRYLDVQPYTIDGISDYYPTVSVNYTTGWGYEGRSPCFDLSTIKPVAQAIFGKDIKIKEPVYGEDFEFDELHWPQYYFYLVTPDNQSNSNFSRYEFSCMSGEIRDANSTADVERLFNVAADFEHYIISVYDRNLHLMYLEYYDRDFKKIWGREFENVDSIPYDYTSKEIALVADNDLYLIDTQTGEDLCDPIMVGEKVSVNITEDGILMIGTGNKDNVMKIDREGSIVWRASVDLEVSGCNDLQIVDGNVIVDLYYAKQEQVDYMDGYQIVAYRSDIVAIDNTGEIISQFTDFSYGL